SAMPVTIFAAAEVSGANDEAAADFAPELDVAPHARLTADTVVGGRYRIERKVAQGGMGEIWLAEHLGLHAKVALKFLLPHALSTPEIAQRFDREAELLARLRTDRVARALDVVEDEQLGRILVMEYVSGPSLAEVFERQTFSVEETIDLALDVLS